jgi:hypothetical protein
VSRLEIIRATAREAEALGYSSFWVNHPGSMDGLGALAHAAGDTRRIELGIGVIPLHTRGPVSIAEGVKRHALPSTVSCSASAAQPRGAEAGARRGRRTSARSSRLG